MDDWTALVDDADSSKQNPAKPAARAAAKVKVKRERESAEPRQPVKRARLGRQPAVRAKREARQPGQQVKCEARQPTVQLKREQHHRHRRLHRLRIGISKKQLAAHKSILPENDPDLLHSKTCTRRDCPRCYFTKHKSAWMKLAPWLQGRSKDGRFMLGCTICEAAGILANSKWGRFEVAEHAGKKQKFMIANILRHGAQKRHCLAAGGRDDTSLVNGVLVPTRNDFRVVMKSLLANEGTGAKGIKNIGTGNKIRKFKYCCAEGARIIARSQLRSALTLAIHQDVRKGRLLVRYTGCNMKLEVVTGTMGQIKLPRNFTLDADGIKGGTLKIIKTFCLTRCRPPFCGRERQLVDTPLAQHIRDIVELWDTDAAGNQKRTRSKHVTMINLG